MDCSTWAERISAALSAALNGATFSGQRDDLRRAAAVLAESASPESESAFDLDSEDALAFSEFVDRLAAELRATGPEGKARATAVPSPLLYALGAWWGEWLVRKRRARWSLPARFSPDLTGPRRVVHEQVASLLPFAQVAQALQAESPLRRLASQAEQRFLWPHPLIATPADAQPAYARLLPEPARRAMEIEQMIGDYQAAWELYRHALELDPASPPLLARMIACAWRLEQWNAVESTSLRLLELAPDHPTTRHNLAVLYSRSRARLPAAVEQLRAALTVHPAYSRARLTLASCLWDLRHSEEALVQARWVVEHDPRLRPAAEEFLQSVRRD